MDEEGVSMEEFKAAFEKGNEFASGIGTCDPTNSLIIVLKLSAVNYGPSVIVAKDGDSPTRGNGFEPDRKEKTHAAISNTQLASKIEIGKRMPSFKILNQSDARPWHLQELLKSNGRWRVLVFPGTLAVPSTMQRMQKLGERLGAQESFIRRFTPPDQSFDSVIEILTVHAGPRTSIEMLDLPEAFHPYSKTMGWDYWKVFVDDQSYHEGHGQAYENYGIDPARGASVIVRPDQYVSWVGEVDDYDSMERFFSAFMRPRGIVKAEA